MCEEAAVKETSGETNQTITEASSEPKLASEGQAKPTQLKLEPISNQTKTDEKVENKTESKESESESERPNHEGRHHHHKNKNKRNNRNNRNKHKQEKSVPVKIRYLDILAEPEEKFRS